MSQGSFVTITLRDGTQASVGYDGVRVGERVFALADIQDARQVAPDPETLAMRVANERHVVELQPAHSGDGALLLEAIFRLKPELRPAGFESPTSLPAGFPPLPSQPSQSTAPTPWGMQSTWPPHPGMYTPPPVAYMPPPMPYTPPGSSGGRLTPYPRSISELIGAVFELFIAHWRRWLLLGLVAVFVPEILHGSVDALFQVLGGNDLWAGLSFATSGTASSALGAGNTAIPAGNDLLLLALGFALSQAIGALVGGWAAAVLGSAGREAIFGRAPQVGASIRSGLKRIFPAIGANILSGIFVLLILLPVIVLYGIMLTQFSAFLTNPNTIDPASPAANAVLVLGCLTLILVFPCGFFAIYVTIRLFLAPYIAATEPLGPLAAVRKSWYLTRGQWWHTFTPVFVIAILTTLISFPASFVEYASYGAAVLLVTPLVSALTYPLVAIVAVVVLYDLRLRREGYAPLASEGSSGDEPVTTPV